MGEAVKWSKGDRRARSYNFRSLCAVCRKLADIAKIVGTRSLTRRDIVSLVLSLINAFQGPKIISKLSSFLPNNGASSRDYCGRMVSLLFTGLACVSSNQIAREWT